jgi:hypothetical protein
VFYRVISVDEKRALAAAKDGRSFGQICALLAEQSQEIDVSQQAGGFLGRWFNDGLISRLCARAD